MAVIELIETPQRSVGYRIGGPMLALAALVALLAVRPGVSLRDHGSSPRGSRVESAPPVAPAPPPELHFTANPSDEEFLRTGLFVQPLVPVGETSRQENRELAWALKAYEGPHQRGDIDAIGPVLDFLSDHPKSTWLPSLLVGLGAIYRTSGHMSKALETWQAAWDASKQFRDGNGRIVG